MPVFNQLFNEWVTDYDETVYGHDNEYIEVFQDYNKILKTICHKVRDKKEGTILEIGVGTGEYKR